MLQCKTEQDTQDLYEAIKKIKGAGTGDIDASGSATPPLTPQPSPLTTDPDGYVPAAQLLPTPRVELGPAVAIAPAPAPAPATMTTTTPVTRAAPSDEYYLIRPLHTVCRPPVAQPAEWLTRCLELLGAVMLVFALYFGLPAFAAFMDVTTVVSTQINA
jgi:hypothetical protein